MRALVCKAHGSTDDLVIEEWYDPTAGPGEVVIDVHAAGINFPDLLVVAGKYQDRSEPPFVPGNEAAGVVSEVGDGVTHLKPGDRVLALPRGGAFADKLAIRAAQVAPLPAALDFVSGAGFGVTYGTSYHALKQCADLKREETVLVLGAAGGVGIAAVALARAMGARVIAAASDEAKLEFARDAGADATINYSDGSLKDAARALTDGSGVDVVVDPVGGELAQQALRALAWHGRHLVIGFASGDIQAFPANIALLKEAKIVGVWWGTWVARHLDEHVENVRELAAWLEDGTLAPLANQAFPLDDYQAAFRQLSERRALGKVVLDLQGSTAR